MTMRNSSSAEWVKTFIRETQQSIFLTGKAGTGKTTLLREIVQQTHKRTVVTAPTGMAAMQAGGVTLHSLFHLPMGAYLPGSALPGDPSGLSPQQSALIKSLELLIIDEVSMLRADLLDAIDGRMRKVRKNGLPFGGVQLLLIGDLMQLPPVIKKEDWALLKGHYQGLTFFQARAFQQNPPLYLELQEVHRQADPGFVQLLNHLRNNRLSQEDWTLLNSKVEEDFDIENHPGYMYLTTHRQLADAVNTRYLQGLQGQSRVYKAKIEGDFPPTLYPTETTLTLKIGAQVMFIRNDPSGQKRFFNGKMGKIVCLEEEFIGVALDEGEDYLELGCHRWENIRYEMEAHKRTILPQVRGAFYQFPVRIARAITIHKSQGSTFEKACLDLKHVFQPGQAYVAFSRLRGLEGLVLKHPLSPNFFQKQPLHQEEFALQLDELTLQARYLLASKEYLLKQVLGSLEVDSLIHCWQKQYRREQKFEEGGFSSLVYEQLKSLSASKKLLQLHRKKIQGFFRKDNLEYSSLIPYYQQAGKNYFRLIRRMYYQVQLMLQCLQSEASLSVYTRHLEEMNERLLCRLASIPSVLRILKYKQKNLVCSKELLDGTMERKYKDLYWRRAQRQRELFHLHGKVDALADKVFSVFQTPVKSAKMPMKASEEITLQLFKEGKDMDEIAKIRGLSKKTILLHLQNLIQKRKINLKQYMGESSMEFLAYLFKEHYQASRGIAHLKALTQGDFTRDELILFKAYWLKGQ
jgi:DNA-binding CsgD family transcriptional regulator